MARVSLATVAPLMTGNPFTPLISASVQVNVRGGAAATVFAAATGGTTVANPRPVDINGNFTGWVDTGSYDLVISATGISSFTFPWEAVSAADVLQLSLPGSFAAPGNFGAAYSWDTGSTKIGSLIGTLNVAAVAITLSNLAVGAVLYLTAIQDTTGDRTLSVIIGSDTTVFPVNPQPGEPTTFLIIPTSTTTFFWKAL